MNFFEYIHQLKQNLFYLYQATAPFDSMEDFVNQGEYKWSHIDGTYPGPYFKVRVLFG